MELSKAFLFAFILFFPHALALDIFFNTSFTNSCAKIGYYDIGCSFDDVRIWSSGTVPTAADTVTINGDASILVAVFATDSYTIASLSMQHALLLLKGPDTNFTVGDITLTQGSELRVGGQGPMWKGNFVARQISLDHSQLTTSYFTTAAFTFNVTASNSSSLGFRCGKVVAENVIIDRSSSLTSYGECGGSVYGNLINDGLTGGYGDGTVYVKGNFIQSATSTLVASNFYGYPLEVTGSAIVGGTVSYDLLGTLSYFKNVYAMIKAAKITGHFKKNEAVPSNSDSLPTMSIVIDDTEVSLVYYNWKYVWVPTVVVLGVVLLIIIIAMFRRGANKKRLAGFTNLVNY